MQLANRHQKATSGPTSQLFEGGMAYFTNPYSADTNPTGIINLGTAENRLQGADMAAKLKTVLDIEPSDLLYGDFTGSPALRTELAHIFQRHFVLDDKGTPNRVICPDEISVHNGCGSTIELFMSLLVDPGDGILIPAPLYGGFMGDIEARSGGVVVPVHTEAPSFTLSLEDLDRACVDFTTKNGAHKVSCMIVCNPNNPLGQVYSKEAVITLAKWAKDKGIWIIFDEIYAISTYRQHGETLQVTATRDEAEEWNSVVDKKVQSGETIAHEVEPSGSKMIPSRFYSAMNLPDDLYQNVVTLWGFSKDLAANGLRLGVAHTTNPQIKSGLFSYTVFTSYSRSTDRSVTKMLQDRDWVDEFWITSNQRLDKACTHLCEQLSKYQIPIVPATAGLFVWVDLTKYVKMLCSDFAHRDELAKGEDVLFRLFLKHGLYIPGSRGFEYQTPGWYRIIFSMPQDLLDLGLERMGKALEEVVKIYEERK